MKLNFIARFKDQITPRKKSNDLELALIEPPTNPKPPPRKIYRLPTSKNVVVEITQQQNGDHSETFNDPPQNTEQQRTTDLTKKNNKLEKTFPRFGPCYGDDLPGMSDSKKQALEHVLEKTSPENPGGARQLYMAAMRELVQKARIIYSHKIECSDISLGEMMMKDGCFFLQLALLILGGSKQLGYPAEHLIFGTKLREKDVKKWIEAMFFIGNQIPLVVLKELMAQKFFKDVIANKGKWDPPPSSALCKKVLYNFLVLPALEQNQGEEEVSDLVHVLHNLVMGPGLQSKKTGIHEADYDFDMESNDQNNYNNNTLEDHPRTTNNNDPKRFFPSATDLDQLGISVKLLKNGGVRSICFKSYYFWATIYLPALPIDDDVEMIFRNLTIYENSPQLEINYHKGEVNSYIRFMSDLIQSSKDVTFLKKKGIIEGSSDNQDELPEMLRRLSVEDKPLTPNFQYFRRKIRDYSGPPWARIKNILNLVAVLTLIQTFFTVLAYFRPPKQ